MWPAEPFQEVFLQLNSWSVRKTAKKLARVKGGGRSNFMFLIFPWPLKGGMDGWLEEKLSYLLRGTILEATTHKL